MQTESNLENPNRLRGWYFAAFGLLCAVLFWVGTLTPPMQSPDEGTHLVRAYAVSKGRWLPITPHGKMTGDMVDRQLLQYGLAGTYEWLQGTRQLTQERRAELAAMAWDPDGAEIFFESPGAAYYAPLVYLPHVLGLAVGRWFGFTIEASVAWARFFVIATTAALMVAAVVTWRPPLIVLGLLLLPMTVFQAASPTIDGITIGALMLGLSLFLRFYAEQKRMPWVTASVFLICLTVCVTSRVHTLVLLLLPFVLYLRTRQRAMLAGGVACAAMALSWTVFAMVATVDLRKARSITTMESLKHFISSPDAFFTLLYRTLISPERQEQYAKSFIGIMGWFDIPLSQAQYLGFALGLAAMALLSARNWSFRYWPVRLVLMGSGLVSALVVFLALAITYTDAHAATIDGVQGRYFLPPAIIFAFGVFWSQRPADATCWKDKNPARAWLPIIAAIFFAMASVMVLFDVLEDRFNQGQHSLGMLPPAQIAWDAVAGSNCS